MRHERCRITKCSRPVSSRLSKQSLRFLRQQKTCKHVVHVRKAKNFAKFFFYFVHLDVFINKRLLALIMYKNNISSDNYILTYIPLERNASIVKPSTFYCSPASYLLITSVSDNISSIQWQIKCCLKFIIFGNTDT